MVDGSSLMTIGYTSAVVRRAVVISVNYDDGVLHTRWLDTDGIGPIVPIPHPLVNRGGSGIFVGIKVGTVLVLSMAAYKSYVPVAVLPITAYYDPDAASIPEADFDDIAFPYIESGDIVLQGTTGAQLRLNNDRNIEEIILNNEFGEGIIIGGGHDSFRCSVDTASPVKYVVGSYGLEAAGIVRRDVKIENVQESFVDFLTALDSEQTLEEIGWDPSKQVTYISGGMDESIKGQTGGMYRNPAFVEKRQILYEYGRDWNVGTIEEEKSYLESTTPPIASFEYRSQRRSNSLGLSLLNPNELLESISGTVIDIFGNPIDINRKMIEPPSPSDDKATLLEETLEKARHTIAHHMEINVRKGLRFDEKPRLAKRPVLLTDPRDAIDSVANNSRDRSRWFIDVDKEGLTKINIPASSETGNVPMIARYENSSVLDIDIDGNPSQSSRDLEDTKKIFRNEKNRDIFTEQVGPGGITVKGSPPDNRMSGKKTSWVESDSTIPSGNKTQEIMGSDIEAGTAFHSITKTAWALIKENINKEASDVFFNGTIATTSGLPALSDEINPEVPTNSSDIPNAGGRSVHMNLDGSLEMSIGANTIDRVSVVMDTAGALIYRLGRDKSGRSAVVHADGTVALEIGGFDYVGESSSDEVDTRFAGGGKPRADILTLDPNQFRSGKLVIKIRRAKQDKSGPEANDTLLIIDETGVTLCTPGRLDFISDQNMTFTSKSLITLEAPKVQIYRDNPKYFARTARLIK